MPAGSVETGGQRRRAGASGFRVPGHVCAVIVAGRIGRSDRVALARSGPEEYTAGAFRAACQRLGVQQSIGRPGELKPRADARRHKQVFAVPAAWPPRSNVTVCD